MRTGFLALLALTLLGWCAAPALSQEKAPPPSPTPPPAANLIAATVNDQAIQEIAVQRGLKRVPPAKHAEARPEILKFLIDNVLLDQYLAQRQLTVDNQEVDAKVKQVHEEIQKQGGSFDKVMQDFMLSDAELRAQIVAQLRWERFITTQATDKALHDLFDRSHDMFDGTMVRARHILLMPPSGDAQANADAKAKLLGFKKEIEDVAAQALAKLPASADNLEREKARAKVVDETFAALAKKESACPSKAQSGDLGWFPRAGNMVEPFAKAAFALKPFQMSEVVTTQFGHHLILLTDRRPGKDVKFEEVKEEVKEVYADKLREVMSSQLRPTAKIVINTPPKP